MSAPSFPLVSGSFGDVHRSLKFGGQQIPVGNNMTAGTLAYIDLNDAVNWFAQSIKLPDAHQIQLAQQLWRGKATEVAEDYGSMVIKVPFYYEESASPIHQVRSKMFAAGLQWLTLDQGNTGWGARLLSFADSSDGLEPVRYATAPLGWKGTLIFLVKEPFLQDIASTTTQIFANVTAGAQSGTLTYPGYFRTRPVMNFSTPAGNTAVITQVQVQNTDSGQTCTIPNLSIGAGAHTLSIDCDQMLITIDGAGNYDVSGGFLDLFPDPQCAAGVNHITLTVTLGSGSLAAATTFSMTYNSRW